MRWPVLAIALVALGAAIAPPPALGQSAATAASDRELHDEVTTGGPWHFRSVPCVDGTVDDVGPRLGNPGQRVFTAEDYRRTGVSVHVRLARPTVFLSGTTHRDARVVHYQGEFDNGVMASERPGDRVQVCLMGFPTPTFDATRKRFMCDPDRDGRGWVFRIYDYRRRVSFFGPDSQHSCGGA